MANRFEASPGAEENDELAAGARPAGFLTESEWTYRCAWKESERV